MTWENYFAALDYIACRISAIDGDQPATVPVQMFAPVDMEVRAWLVGPERALRRLGAPRRPLALC